MRITRNPSFQKLTRTPPFLYLPAVQAQWMSAPQRPIRITESKIDLLAWAEGWTIFALLRWEYPLTQPHSVNFRGKLRTS